MATTPYTLTKLDIAALKQADYLVVWYHGNDSAATTAHAVKRRERTEKDPFADDARHIIDAPIRIRVFEQSGLFNPNNNHVRAVASVSFYHSQKHEPTVASSIVRILRAGDEIEFVFSADAHTTQGLREVGFHGDCLHLHVKRGERRFRFELVDSTGPDNSARMVKGAPYRTDAA